MSNRVLRFINNTSHKEPLDTNQKGDILRTGDDEYSVRIDKEYHVLTDNVKTIETDEYLKAEKTDNNVYLSIDEQPFIELIKNNCCDKTYETQIFSDYDFSKFITDGNVFRFSANITKNKIDELVNDSVGISLNLNEFTNIPKKNGNLNTFTATGYGSFSGVVSMIDITIEVYNNDLMLFISDNALKRLNLDDSDSLLIDFTGILDFEKPVEPEEPE